MAKAKQVPAVGSAADPYEWAAAVLRLRFDEVMSYGGAALIPWNINVVHDMRVALRRLRSAFRDFVPVIEGKSLKQVKKDLKQIADLLGAVRDQDVAIIALEEFAAKTNDASIKAGISEFIKDQRILREQAHDRLERTYTLASLDDVRGRFSATIDDALRQQDLLRPASVQEIARRVIEVGLRDFCERGIAIYDPFDIQQLHRLRIAAKRLRYALQLFAQCWGDEITGFASQVSKLQSRLGEVHDCDLWIKNLTKNPEDEAAIRSRNSPPGLSLLYA